MKTFKYFFGAFCAIGLMASCSSSDDVADNVAVTPNKEGNSYIAISVKTVDDAATRAVISGQEPGNSADYEYGTETESAVNKVAFFFFDSEGNPAKVVVNPLATTGGKVNYFESVANKVGDESPNVETVLSAMVIINTTNSNDFPNKIVAVLNGDVADGVKEDGSGKSLTELKATVGNYAYVEGAAEGFLMSSTAYKGTDNSLKLETDVSDDNFKKTISEAENDPVTIYVERVLAKVSVAASSALKGAGTADDDKEVAGAKLYYTGQTVDRTEAGKKIYVKLGGWNVARQADKSFLVKNIQGWTDDALGITNWSWPAYFRSFWAMNPEGVSYINHNYNASKALTIGTVDEKGYVVYGGEGAINYTYVQENASPYNTDAATVAAPTSTSCVIVPAQLVKEDGSALAIAEWKGVRSDEAGILTAMANFSTLYYKDTYTVDGEEKTKRVKITPEMIEFDADCFVKLKSAEESKTFYMSSIATEEKDAAAANESLKGLGAASVYKDGMTYYFAPIQHLGSEGKVAQYGVVRNHSYQVILTSVKGLGTAVYNPDEIIDPVDPVKEESFLAAQIKVLSWRVVKNTVDLGK